MDTGCPSDDDLVRMVEGALADASLAAIELHVDGCARCAAAIGGLGAAATAQRPRELGRYHLDRRIAAGGMGEVWAAWDPKLEREIAVKLVAPARADDGRERERLLREARALAKLAHPNVLAVHDVGEHAGEVFLATELVVGETLASRGGANADWRALARLYVQAARGLAAAHAAGLVHRDVKPANLLLGADGRVRVADFGLAVPPERARVDPNAPTLDGSDPAAALAPAHPSVTVTGYIAGTPAYMAPEQRDGAPADARCDQFALALALAEGVAGRRPDPTLDADALVAFVAERRPREPELAALCGVLVRGMAHDPLARFPDMTALADAIDGAIGAAIGAPGPEPARAAAAPGDAEVGALDRAVTRSRRRRALGGAIALAAMAAIAVAAFAVGASGSHDDAANLGPAPSREAPAQPANAPTVAAPPPTMSATSLAPNASVPPAASPSAPPPAPPAAPARHHAAAPRVGVASHDALEAAALAIRRHDKRCAATLAGISDEQLSNRERLQLAGARAECRMVSGDCDAGALALAALSGHSGAPDPATLRVYTDLYCSLDDPDPAVRHRRLMVQVEQFNIAHDGCDHYVAPARAFAAEAKPTERISAGAVLVALAKCMSENSRCDDAHGLLREAQVLIPAVDNSELTADCR